MIFLECICHNQRTNIGTLLLTTLYSYFTSFSLMSFFCSKTNLGYQLHLVVLSPLTRLVCNSFSDFVFNNLDSFKEHWSDILVECPQFWFIWCFSHCWTGVVKFQEEGHEGHSRHIISRVHVINMMSLIILILITWLRHSPQVSPL